MSKKLKNRHKQNIKKKQKQQKRQEKVKKQSLVKHLTHKPNIEDTVDYALELLENGDKQEGKKVLDELKKKSNQHSHIYYGCGVFSAADAKYDDAIYFFTKATQISPNFIEAHYNLGVAYQKQLNIPSMIKTFKKVIEIGEPDSQLVLQTQKIIIRLEQQVQDSDGVSLDDYVKGNQFFDQGVKYMESENWTAAITKFNETIKISPDHPQSYGNIGICYSKLKQNQEALSALDKAIELDPYYEPALVNRKMIESLAKGERLDKELKVIDYYKDYTQKKRSFIREVAKNQGLLP